MLHAEAFGPAKCVLKSARQDVAPPSTQPVELAQMNPRPIRTRVAVTRSAAGVLVTLAGGGLALIRADRTIA